jgi:transcriptional repressor NrdR
LERRELFVVKRDQSRERFDREKLKESLNKAVEKRPISRGALDEAVEAIVSDLEALQENEISSERIGLEVMKRLQSLDPVAYVRFASVYRQFEDVGQFIDAVQFLERFPEPPPGHPELFSRAAGRSSASLVTPTD